MIFCKKEIRMRIKLTMFLMTCFFIQVSATGYGQTVTLDEKSRTVKQLFEEIRKQTGYNVVWSPETIDEKQKLTLEFKNSPMKDVLEQIAALEQLEYSIRDRTIVIKEKMKSTIGGIS